MTLSMVLSTVFEIFLFAVLVWGIFNEERLVAFERRIFSHFRRRKLKIVKPTNSYPCTQTSSEY